jgi:hypothetical protein
LKSLIRNPQPLPCLPNGIYFSVYSIGVKFFGEKERSEFNRGATRNTQPPFGIKNFGKISTKL